MKNVTTTLLIFACATHSATLRLRRGRQNTVVVAIHDQVSDAVAYSSRELTF